MSEPRLLQPMVRAYVTPTDANTERDPDISADRPARRPAPLPSPWSLVFDTETTTDLGQRLRLVTYQVRKGNRICYQGIALGQRLPAAERATITEYCRRHNLDLLTREQFLDLLFRIAVDRRGTIIGFNQLKG